MGKSGQREEANKATIPVEVQNKFEVILLALRKVLVVHYRIVASIVLIIYNLKF